jgi:hypothetical protein
MKYLSEDTVSGSRCEPGTSLIANRCAVLSATMFGSILQFISYLPIITVCDFIQNHLLAARY